MISVARLLTIGIASLTTACLHIPRHAEPAPNLILARAPNLRLAAQQIRQRDTSIMPAFNALIRAADSALVAQPRSVVHKRRLPPSGNKHDFMSMAPYWWPDTTKPDGLPFIRRDGVMYPESRTDHDGVRFQTMSRAVESLALAYYFTGDRRYAERAGTHLRVWFVDDSTRMNPNLRYAQAVLGVSEGRGIGIIDTRTFPQLLDAVRILESTNIWTANDRVALEAWCRAYLDWLRTSPHGIEERAAENNHGTWYDSQALALALFLGDSAFAREVVLGPNGTRARIASHIRPDGSQPLELARTRPLHYSLFNLEAFSHVAEMARNIGADLWSYVAPTGGSLRGASLFVGPYVSGTAQWPTPEIAPLTPTDVAIPLRRVAAGTGDRLIWDRFARDGRAVRENRILLYYPR